MLNKVNEQPFVIFSSLTEDIGHLILDDLFWFRNLVQVGKKTIVYSSEFSIRNLSKLNAAPPENLIAFRDFPVIKNINYRLFLIFRMFFIKPIRNKKIIIQGFDEITILFFFWKIWKRNNKVALILTNNVSPERLKRSKKFLPFLLIKIFRQSDRVYYHTDFEFNLIKKLVKDEKLLIRFVKLKYHLLGAVSNNDEINKNPKIISYFGPVMNAKPLSNIIDLMRADEKHIYKYHFFNVDAENIIYIRTKIPANTRVEFSDRFMKHEQYISAIKESTYVLLPHNWLYEGKLSGIFSDCIANGVPVISDLIEPVIEYFKAYGSMGYIFDFHKNQHWAKEFLTGYDDNLYESFKLAMKNCQTSHLEEKIIEEFITTFENNPKFS
jgi:hypothetical protein